jgi:multiple sugar transport system ATP-binding protein
VAEITLDRVVKVFPDGTEAVRGLSLEVPDGELMVFVGPSGCGKTTALRMIAGLEEISDGEIRIGDQVVNDLPPRERDVAMVFQNYALYPHKTVFENLAFPLKLRGYDKHQIEQQVRRIARLLELEEYLKRRPRQLSGGQRQRVAMGRAIVREPQAFLMDEPLSNLDAKLRASMRAEISLLHRELRVTTVYVTHDQVEAMTLGQRVAVMRQGELQQVGPPQELYHAPVNLFVAGFIGSPATNFVAADVSRGDGRFELSFGSERLVADDDELGLNGGGLDRYVGRSVVAGIRPEYLEDAALATGTPPSRRFRGRVQLTEALGSEVVVHLQVQAAPVVTDDLVELARDVDQSSLDDLEHQRQQRRTAFVARFGAATRVREDTEIEVAVAPGALRFFDPETGRAVGADATG